MVKEIAANITEATERTRSSTEQASRTDVSGQCEVFAKCEWCLGLPQNVERKRLGPARTTEKRATASHRLCYILLISPFRRSETAKAKPKFLYLSFSALRRGVWGGRTKNERKFWVLPASACLPKRQRRQGASAEARRGRHCHARRA